MNYNERHLYRVRLHQNTAIVHSVTGPGSRRARLVPDGAGAPRRKQRARFAAQKLLDRGRSDDFAIIDESLVVGLDLVEIIKVIDHDRRRFTHALGGSVARPVDLLQSRAIAEVKPRH